MNFIDLSFKIKDLKGKVIEFDGKSTSAGEFVADKLAASTENTSKFMDWATKLTFDKPIQIDDTDFELLDNFIQNKSKLTNIVKEPIRIYFKEVKEKREKKEESKNK